MITTALNVNATCLIHVQIVSDGVTQVSHELTNYYHRKGEINWEILLLLCITSNNE